MSHQFKRIVCYLAKIWILKQITTCMPLITVLSNCLLSCKDMNFKANHNHEGRLFCKGIIVCYLAKIWILKQITTLRWNIPPKMHCLLSCKDMNFKANHNTFYSRDVYHEIVCYLAKIWILKQITTYSVSAIKDRVLFVILQRYEF